MIELGELEAHQAEFTQRNTRVVVASVEDRETAAKSQAQFPHLTVLADADKGLVSAAGLLHNAASTHGRDSAAPTTILVDHREGVLDVRAGQAVVAHRGEWVRYSTPERDGAEYVAICIPAFAPQTVHRDPSAGERPV